jgi:hypothetical protein
MDTTISFRADKKAAPAHGQTMKSPRTNDKSLKIPGKGTAALIMQTSIDITMQFNTYRLCNASSDSSLVIRKPK